MKILVVGGTGTIGREVVAALRGPHEVIAAGNRRGGEATGQTLDARHFA